MPRETPFALQRPLPRKFGPSLILNSVHLNYIEQLISQNPVIYQDEIQTLLPSTFGVSVSLTTICQAIYSLEYSYLRVSKAAVEQNDLPRQAFKGHAGQIVQFSDQPIFIDESAKDKKTYERRFGYAKKALYVLLQYVDYLHRRFMKELLTLIAFLLS
ncbi:hypothetical protein RSOLAG22IIIB_05775 [Rhizoctonia solani]|uniref:Uncharacterized protein n=1 Tax=Rhizoctonia solani TaxID=456999 RepID=A0A0K6G9A7_9AGAM|nr:hypothetical protein RSOLAG22IIIB_05775 [Rhizoctonia solani]